MERVLDFHQIANWIFTYSNETRIDVIKYNICKNNCQVLLKWEYKKNGKKTETIGIKNC